MSLTSSVWIMVLLPMINEAKMQGILTVPNQNVAKLNSSSLLSTNLEYIAKEKAALQTKAAQLQVKEHARLQAKIEIIEDKLEASKKADQLNKEEIKTLKAKVGDYQNRLNITQADALYTKNVVIEKVEAQMDDLRHKVAVLQVKDRNKTIQITTLQSKVKALETEKRCPDGWEKWSLHCYKFVTILKTWTDARAYCIKQGADLLKITNWLENAYIKGRVETRYTVDRTRRELWFGANDRATEGTWTWADGSRMTFNNWSDDEPNDYKGNEDCGSIYQWGRNNPYAGKWNDLPCTNFNHFICEKSI